VSFEGFDATSPPSMFAHVVGLLRWLVGWLVGTALLRSLVCRWYSSFLPSFVGRKPFFLWYLVVGLRSLVHRSCTFVCSSVGFRPSFVRRSRALWWSLLRLDDGRRRRCFSCCCCCDAELSCAWSLARSWPAFLGVMSR
jgi:hypothetical protein